MDFRSLELSLQTYQVAKIFQWIPLLMRTSLKLHCLGRRENQNLLVTVCTWKFAKICRCSWFCFKYLLSQPEWKETLLFSVFQCVSYLNSLRSFKINEQRQLTVLLLLTKVIVVSYLLTFKLNFKKMLFQAVKQSKMGLLFSKIILFSWIHLRIWNIKFMNNEKYPSSEKRIFASTWFLFVCQNIVIRKCSINVTSFA